MKFKEEFEKLGYEVVEVPSNNIASQVSKVTDRILKNYYGHFATLGDEERTKIIELVKIPIEELIKVEYKSRKMALALENKAEFFRSKADMYLEMLLELENCEKEESNDK